MVAGASLMSDGDRLAEMLEEADLRVLLMALYHRTGDRRWLEEPFRPRRDVKLIADEDAGFPPDVQQAIRRAAADLFTDLEAPAAIGDPGDALMVEMMRCCLGEDVPPEYAPMMREQMGFTSIFDDLDLPEQADPQAMDPVVIAGAGESGLAIGAMLLKLGIPFVIAERDFELGGTWHQNTYPGCGVDTPNHSYSYSFAKPYPWRSYFSPQPDLKAYLNRCADEFGVRGHIRFRTHLSTARWDEAARRWQVTLTDLETGGTQTVQALAVVSAIGILSIPQIANIPGKDDFKGPGFHTMHWPQGLDLTGKRVAIIGTGASSMQIVPTVADQVENITVFQRTPQWARPIPRYHDDITPNKQWLIDHIPYYAAWFRFTMMWRYGDGLLPYLKIDPEWEHAERSVNKVNDKHRQQMLDHMIAELQGNEELLEKCVPDYPPYGKRILLDNGWFEALLKPTVDLVTDPIDTITETGVRTQDGVERAFDIIVFATGFKVGEVAGDMEVIGRDGTDLRDLWNHADARAYLGITASGFPNFFRMLGPNTGLGHGGSAIFQSECQAHYIVECLIELMRAEADALDVKSDALEDYIARLDAEHDTLIWSHPNLNTYYRNHNDRVIGIMPWRLVDYWHMTRKPALEHFELIGKEA